MGNSFRIASDFLSLLSSTAVRSPQVEDERSGRTAGDQRRLERAPANIPLASDDHI